MAELSQYQQMMQDLFKGLLPTTLNRAPVPSGEGSKSRLSLYQQMMNQLPGVVPSTLSTQGGLNVESLGSKLLGQYGPSVAAGIAGQSPGGWAGLIGSGYTPSTSTYSPVSPQALSQIGVQGLISSLASKSPEAGVMSAITSTGSLIGGKIGQGVTKELGLEPAPATSPNVLSSLLGIDPSIANAIMGYGKMAAGMTLGPAVPAAISFAEFLSDLARGKNVARSGTNLALSPLASIPFAGPVIASFATDPIAAALNAIFGTRSDPYSLPMESKGLQPGLEADIASFMDLFGGVVPGYGYSVDRGYGGYMDGSQAYGPLAGIDLSTPAGQLAGLAALGSSASLGSAEAALEGLASGAGVGAFSGGTDTGFGSWGGDTSGLGIR